MISDTTGFPTIGLYFCPGCTLTIEDATGDIFDLLDFEFDVVGPAPNLISITGFYQGGGTITADLLVESDAQEFQFGSAWSDLSSVVIQGTNDAFANGIDNVRLNVVPVPGAIDGQKASMSIVT